MIKTLEMKETLSSQDHYFLYLHFFKKIKRSVINKIITQIFMAEKKHHHLVSEDSSNILFTCEHASGNIPKEYSNLGLSKKERENCKDLYDPGALEVTNFLAKNLKANSLCADISRLVIDYNRRIDSKTKNKDKHHSCALKTELLVEKDGVEKMIKIPENLFKAGKQFDAEEKRRYEKYVTPYIEEAYGMIDGLRKKHKKTFIIQIHSFYPKYNGEERAVDIGVLFDYAEENAKRIIVNLKKETSLCVAENKPWSIKDTDGIVFKDIEKMDDVDAIVFEINNKHLRTQNGVEEIAKLILKSIKSKLIAH